MFVCYYLSIKLLILYHNTYFKKKFNINITQLNKTFTQSRPYYAFVNIYIKFKNNVYDFYHLNHIKKCVVNIIHYIKKSNV